MKFKKAIDVNDFLRTVESCEGEVWLESIKGDLYVLKSEFSRYIALAALLSEQGENLELYCQLPEDRVRLYNYFHDHPGVN